jgi:hypothetical protein
MTIDPEILEIIQRLSGVFMPHAARRRDQVISTNGRFVHYTTAAAGLSIISTKSIWMRNTTCMADYSEVQHGFSKLRTEAALKPLLDTLDERLSNAGKEAATLFDQWWNDTQYGTFISSISEHDPSEDAHGRLSMWRAFGGQSARVAFVVKIPLTDVVAPTLNIFLSPVAYFKNDELAQEITSVTANVRDNTDFLVSVPRPNLINAIFSMLISAVVCLKHEGFHEEREWRIVYNPRRTPSPLMLSSIELIAGVPQIVYKMPISGGPPDELSGISISNLLDRVIIGPSQYPWAMYEAFVSALTNAGVSDAASKVFVSGIPLRS